MACRPASPDVDGQIADGTTLLTQFLEIRLPEEADRARFVELFCDEDFMIFSAGVHTIESANTRFDQMLSCAADLPFAKQP